MSAGLSVEQNLKNFGEFVQGWNAYLELRNLPRPTDDVDTTETIMPDPTDGIVYHKDNYVSGTPKVEFPATYGIKERDAFNRWISHHGGSHGFGGASGYDAPIIALDAILGTNSWEEVCEWSMLHGGLRRRVK